MNKVIIITGGSRGISAATARLTAADQGFSCALASDACATRDLQFGGQRIEAAGVQLAYLARLNGLFARVLPAETLCAEP